jgi:threonine dehydratase
MKAGTLADGLAVPIVGAIAFDVARRFVDSTCAVSEVRGQRQRTTSCSALPLGRAVAAPSPQAMISLAVLRCLELEKTVVEGGGVVGQAPGSVHVCVCARKCVCVRMCARVRARVCVCVNA